MSNTTDDRFHGAWRLVSPVADGMLYYDASGEMSVQSAPRHPRPRAAASPSPQEALTALDGYIAYFGTYAIDSVACTVTHRQVATVQPGPPVDLVRRYEFAEGDRLILRPIDRPGEIIWQRIAPPASEQGSALQHGAPPS